MENNNLRNTGSYEGPWFTSSAWRAMGTGDLAEKAVSPEPKTIHLTESNDPIENRLNVDLSGYEVILPPAGKTSVPQRDEEMVQYGWFTSPEFYKIIADNRIKRTVDSIKKYCNLAV